MFPNCSVDEDFNMAALRCKYLAKRYFIKIFHARSNYVLAISRTNQVNQITQEDFLFPDIHEN